MSPNGQLHSDTRVTASTDLSTVQKCIATEQVAPATYASTVMPTGLYLQTDWTACNVTQKSTLAFARVHSRGIVNNINVLPTRTWTTTRLDLKSRQPESLPWPYQQGLRSTMRTPQKNPALGTRTPTTMAPTPVSDACCPRAT